MAEPPVGVVFVEVRPDFTAFEAELTAKLKAISAAGIPAGATAGTTKLGKATASTTSTITKSTKAIEGEVEALSHFQRGLAATSLSSLGLRGATLAATGPFLAGAAIVTTFAKAIHAASSEEESAARVTRVFGDEIGGNLEKNAGKLASTFGLSANEALNFEGQIGNLLTQVGETGDKAATTSQAIVKLAADMAAFANVPVDKTLRAITLGLVGNSRGLRSYQVELNQARVNQEALRISGKRNTDQLTRQEIIQARINLLFQQTVNQQGSAQRRSDGLAQSTKELTAEMENLAAGLGKLVTGPFAGVIHDLGEIATGIKKVSDEATKAAQAADQKTQGKKGGFFSDLRSLATKSLPDLIGAAVQNSRNLGKELAGVDVNAKVLSADMSELHDAAKEAFDTGNPRAYGKALLELSTDSHDTSVAMDFLHQHAQKAFERKSIDDFIQGLKDAIFQAQHLAVILAGRAFTAAANQLATLQDIGVQTQISTPSQAALLPNLAAQEAAARREVAAAEAANALTGGRSPARLERLRKARETLLGIIEQERSIRKQIADDAAQAAQKRKDDAEKARQLAQKRRDEADQALLAAFGLEQGEANLAVITADATKQLNDDIAAQVKLQAVLTKEIAQAQKINNLLLRRQTVQDLRTQRLQSQNTVKELRAQQRQAAIDARQNVLEKQKESLQLDIDIAQTQKNKTKELHAHQALLAWLTERLKHYRRNTVQWKQLVLEINQERAAIADLRKASEKRADELKVAEFQFLQEQQGFVGRLLGNLLPIGAVAGTVGTGSISTSTSPSAIVPNPLPNLPGAHTGPASLTAATQKGAAVAGVTQGQGNVQITLLRNILRTLVHLSGQRTHPEAAVSKAQQAVAFDIL